MPRLKRGDVQKHKVLDVPLEDGALDGGTEGHHFIGIDGPVRFLAEEVPDQPLDERHPGLAADENDLVQLLGGLAALLERILDGDEGEFNQVLDHFFQLLAGEGGLQVLRPAGSLGDEGQADLDAIQGGEFAFGLFAGFLEALEGHAIAGQVDAGLLAELLHQPVLDGQVDVLAAEEGVAAGGQHLEDAVIHLHEGEIDGAPAKIIDAQDLFDALLVEPVGQGRGRGLVDDALDVQPGDACPRPWWPGAGRRRNRPGR